MRLVTATETKQALGGDATYTIVAGEDTDTSKLFAQLWRQTFQFERRFSRFLPDSELSRINYDAGLKLPASPELSAILRAAQELTVRTSGLFNPFILPALQRAGYKNSAVEKYASDQSPDYTDRSVASPEKLEIGDGWVRIPYGTALDLGGCGKGYLADQLGLYLRTKQVVGYWLNLSGDIATYGVNQDGQSIAVAIQDAATGQASDEVIICPPERFAVATSGTLRRDAHRHSLRGHHIINPRTGLPAETDITLATVCAPTTIEADVLASCAVILGSHEAPRFLETQSVPTWQLQFTDESGKLQRISHGAISTLKTGGVHA